jgi:hypothetical protein
MQVSSTQLESLSVICSCRTAGGVPRGSGGPEEAAVAGVATGHGPDLHPQAIGMNCMDGAIHDGPSHCAVSGMFQKRFAWTQSDRAFESTKFPSPASLILYVVPQRCAPHPHRSEATRPSRARPVRWDGWNLTMLLCRTWLFPASPLARSRLRQ